MADDTNEQKDLTTADGQKEAKPASGEDWGLSGELGAVEKVSPSEVVNNEQNGKEEREILRRKREGKKGETNHGEKRFRNRKSGAEDRSRARERGKRAEESRREMDRQGKRRRGIRRLSLRLL